MDISGFFNFFLNLMVSGAEVTYTYLDSITFNGVSLLGFSITLLILSVVVSLVVTLVRSDIVIGAGRFRDSRSRKRRERKEGSND